MEEEVVGVEEEVEEAGSAAMEEAVLGVLELAVPEAVLLQVEVLSKVEQTQSKANLLSKKQLLWEVVCMLATR